MVSASVGEENAGPLPAFRITTAPHCGKLNSNRGAVAETERMGQIDDRDM
jgi:hypothetical protein